MKELPTDKLCMPQNENFNDLHNVNSCEESLNSEDDLFVNRHIGLSQQEYAAMLGYLGFDTLDDFIAAVLPQEITASQDIASNNISISDNDNPAISLQTNFASDSKDCFDSNSDRINWYGLSEEQALMKLKTLAMLNKEYKNYIGFGYHDTIMPNVIKRNVFNNPGWYSAYTPYQAEIAQGRLEALLSYQQLVMDLTGFNLANASLLDEATAAAEAMLMARRINTNSQQTHLLIGNQILPATFDVLATRALYQNIDLKIIENAMSVTGDYMANNNSPDSDIYRNCFAIILQNPSCDGKWIDYSNLIAHLKNINPQLLVIMVCDLLSLVLFKSPAAMGADIAVGSSQRFGVSLGFGGPSAAYIATHECHKRLLPGRIIGVTKDSHGKSALRMSLQTREQHIRRHKATSNICTSQVLLANMAAFYAIYHGKSGLVNIAKRIQKLALYLMAAIDMQMQSQASPAITVSNYSHHAQNDIQNDTHKNPHNATHAIFDTVIIHFAKQNVRDDVYQQLLHNGYLVGLGEFINMPNALCISIGERATKDEVINIASIICAIANYQDGGSNNSTVNNSNAVGGNKQSCEHAQDNKALTLCEAIIDTYRHSDYYRQDEILTHAVFNSYHSETKLMRYLKRLENRDISLVHSMIPLGSCTMKLNAATELEGLSWSQFANIHPYSPALATMGYRRLIDDLSSYLMQITGFSAISMQPNSGAQGEYAGLLAIRRYQKHLQQDHVRDVCLIPQSAHGTNPASASLMGLKVVAVACDGFGNVDIEDLRKKAILHQKELCCFMITYPSTHGVFEAGIKTMCSIIHENGGMVYMDGANLNALVGLVKIADLGADVAHMNLHKTFAIPHGGGGPGMGPIGVIDKLAPFLPSHVTKKIIYGSATNNSNTNNGTTSNNITNDNTNVSAHASHAVSSSPFGSASILLISWMYINLLGLKGLKRSTQTAILSANYIAKRLAAFYPILYSGKNGMVAHECIIDLRPLKEKSTITELDVAKRLMDYGFHAPTMSFPVAGTLMIEPTESEDKAELDRFIAALISIHKEILQVISGEYDITNNPLKNAPHTMADILAWNKPYSIKTGCFPGDWQTTDKIFPSVNRLDDAYGDRQLICSCSGMLKE